MRCVLLLVMFLCCAKLQSQNLVINGSFEDVNICDEYNAPCSPSAWFYFNKTGAAGYSRQGELGAKKQNHYLRIGIARYDSMMRQYWQTQLAFPLESGKKYKVSLKIYAEAPGPNLNDIGLYFSESMLFSWTDSLLQPADYLHFLDAKIKKLKEDWYLVEKEMIASSSNRFLIIGNFSSISNQELLRNRNLVGRKLFIAVDDVAIQLLEKSGNSSNTEALKDSLYGLTRRHYQPPPKIQKAVEVPALKKPVIVDDLEPAVDTIRISNIEFAFNKHTLKSKTLLESFRAQLTQKNIDQILVVGFADRSGEETYNKELSAKRAAEIARLISELFGIDQSRISSEGKGESTQHKEDAKNRRVEILIYYK